MVSLCKKHDQLVLFHSFSDELMPELAPAFLPEAIRSKYRGKLIEDKIPESAASFHFEDQGSYTPLHALHDYLCRFSYAWQSVDALSGYSVYDDVTYSTMFPPDFIVLGSSGVRGRRDESTTMGSLVDRALRTVHIPCIVCKRPCREDKSRKFIMAVDSSEHSRVGLDILMRLVRRCDSLCLLHMIPAASSPRPMESDQSVTSIASEEKSEFHVDTKIMGKTDADPALPSVTVDTVRSYYHEELEKHGPNRAHFVVNEVFLGDGEDIAESLVAYVNAESPDFFAIAPRAQTNMSSITEYALTNVHSSIILCRN